MILVFLSLGNVLRNTIFVKNFQKDIISNVFDTYRMALYTISRRDWNQIANLSLGNPYHLSFDSNQWQIISGATTTQVGLNTYQVSFVVNNFEDNPDIKIVTTTVIFSQYSLQDAFLLPKTK